MDGLISTISIIGFFVAAAVFMITAITAQDSGRKPDLDRIAHRSIWAMIAFVLLEIFFS